MKSGEFDFSLLNEAASLVQAAVHMDKNQNYSGAIDYYDMTILNLNEVLNKLPMGSVGWNKIMEIRSKYDDRLEKLREYENSKYDITSMVSSVMSSSAGESGIAAKSKRPSMSRVTFEEDPQLIKCSENIAESFEKPPTTMARVPYWQMRTLMISIQNGGFITPTLFVPKLVWSQSKAKFSGFRPTNLLHPLSKLNLH